MVGKVHEDYNEWGVELVGEEEEEWRGDSGMVDQIFAIDRESMRAESKVVHGLLGTQESVDREGLWVDVL